MAVACALVFNRLSPEVAKGARGLAVPVLLGTIAILAIASFPTLRSYGQSIAMLVGNRATAQREELLPKYVNEHTLPDETVLVWGGEAGVNFLARREAPTPYFQYGILVPSSITESISAAFIQDIQSHPPALIVDATMGNPDGELVPLSTSNPIVWSAAHRAYAAPHLLEFFDLLHANYSYKTSVAGYPIYILKR
jgi:hypothetical protein